MGNHPALDLDGIVTEHDACSSENAGAPSVITAAGALDNVKVTGQAINRLAAPGNMADSAVIATHFLAGLADTETVSLAHEIQESDDASSWDAAEVIEALTVKGTASGAEDLRGVDKHALTLRGRKKFFRINVTLDLSAAGVDLASFATVVTQGGYDQHPI